MYGYTIDTSKAISFYETEKIDFASILIKHKDTVKAVFDESFIKDRMENIGGDYNPIDFDAHFPSIVHKTVDAILYALVDTSGTGSHSNEYVIGDSDYVFVTLLGRGTYMNHESDLYVQFALDVIGAIDEIKDQVGFKGVGIVLP